MKLTAAAEFAGGFVSVAGSVTGRDHRRANRDGQDGFALVATADVTAAIVTDGCSSGRASEVGARLGAAWIADLVTSLFPTTDPAAAAREVTRGLIERLAATAGSLSPRGGIAPAAVEEMFLFGFLAAVVSGDVAVVFGVGDGLVSIDGAVTVIDPGPENAPTYPAYALLGSEIAPRLLHVGNAHDVDTIAIATDGAEELLAPGSDPSLDALARDPRWLGNPSLLRKRLVVLSDGGRFRDDATIALVRRRA